MVKISRASQTCPKLIFQARKGYSDTTRHHECLRLGVHQVVLRQICARARGVGLGEGQVYQGAGYLQMDLHHAGKGTGFRSG